MLNDFGDKLILSVKKNSFLFMVLKSYHNRSFFYHMVLNDSFHEIDVSYMNITVYYYRLVLCTMRII